MTRFHRQGQHSVAGSRRKGINPEIINVGFTVDSALYSLIETDAGCVDFGIGIIVGSIGGIGGGSEEISDRVAQLPTVVLWAIMTSLAF